MMRRKAAAALAMVGLLGVNSAIAGPRCHVPLADWQPRMGGFVMAISVGLGAIFVAVFGRGRLRSRQ